MPVIHRSLDALLHPAALAVGMFDGVHLGHQAILSSMLEFARAHHYEPWIFSFEGMPEHLSESCKSMTKLYDSALQTYYLSQTNATLIRQPFTQSFANMSAIDFVKRVSNSVIFCGADWRFGKGAAGDVSFLEAHQVETHVIPDVCYKGKRVSSTRIREAVAEGKMDEASAMLGRPWTFYGRVTHGRGLAGKTFGIPTLNLPYIGRAGERLSPLARGVYVGRAEMLHSQGKPSVYSALINFGVAPTVKKEAEPLFEVHLLDVTGDFYGKEVKLSIEHPLLRPEIKFESLDALCAQLQTDVRQCREMGQ